MDDKINIFFACDDNYAPYLVTTMVSILVNTTSEISFYVLDSGISERNISKILFLSTKYKNFKIEFLSVDLKDLFKNFPLFHMEHSLNVFSRYLIPKLKPSLKKVLYMDVDIIIRDDISKLFNIDLGKYHLGAVPEYTNVLDSHIKDDLKLSSKHKYFNAGILLIDNSFFVKNNLLDKLVEMTLDIKPDLQDQDIFNIYFENNYKILDYKYNVSGYMYRYNQIKESKNVSSAIKEPFIIHFTTIKPWIRPGSVFAEYFWEIAKQTEYYEEIIYKNLSFFYNTKTFDVRYHTRNEINNKLIQFKYKKYILFGILPILIVKRWKDITIFYLFGLVPILKFKDEGSFRWVCFISCKLRIFKLER